ncbi:hypothetical protein ACJMK2_031139 [Sinanodonta woodiana]|uniref:Mitochondria-eating protein n=1 Tax=Sinanodonta woodiana TaxID=1069815 RepID=A0ABD3WXX4_SINWO
MFGLWHDHACVFLYVAARVTLAQGLKNSAHNTTAKVSSEYSGNDLDLSAQVSNDCLRLDKPKMAGSDVLEKQLGLCFTHFEKQEWHQLTLYFMNRTLEVYKHNVEEKQKDSLRHLTTFLQHCKDGKWSDARSSYSTALKEYEYYVNTKVNPNLANEPTAGRRELHGRPHSNKEVQETQLISRSKEASIRLKHNNPNISDLSDPNRPNKLAERFSELYSNEYTDALDELVHGTNSIDVESIECLLKIVKKSYGFCMKQRWKMIDEKMQLTGSSPDDHVERYEMMMKLRKTAEEALPNVRQECMKSLEMHMRARTQRFAEQCAEIVWLMCMQQPPMHLECIDTGETFNPDLYRGYTKSGKCIEFCVWPVVRLHKDGPILTRGIAQGCD